MTQFEKSAINLVKAIIRNKSECTVDVKAVSGNSLWLGFFDGEEVSYVFGDMSTPKQIREFEAASLNRIEELKHDKDGRKD